MCELCAATEDTFRKVDGHFAFFTNTVHRGEIVYVVRAGDCLISRPGRAYDSARAAIVDDLGEHVVAELLPWRSELLGQTGLSYPTAEWVLECTSSV